MLSTWPSHGRRTACDLIVMPRSRSMSIRSRYWARMERSSTTPVICSIRSASVDLPWSMCAMMQKLRINAGSVWPGRFRTKVRFDWVRHVGWRASHLPWWHVRVPAMTTRRRVLVWAAAALALILLLATAAVVTLRLQFTGTPAAWARTTGHDALWMGHMWVDGRKGEADVQALAARLRGTGIKDVYVHSGPFGIDGTLASDGPDAKYPNAGNFLKWWRKYLPNVRVSAWLGQSVDEDKQRNLDLADPAA